MPKASAVAERTEDGVVSSYFGDIVKFDDQGDGTLMVYGKATGSDLDEDGQRMNPRWLAKAMPEWMEHGNVREQHSKIAAGVGRELTQTGDDWMLRTHVVDPTTVLKVKTGVLKGYSINVLGARVTKGTPATPNGEIVGGRVGEISLVDRPCLPTAMVSICKALGDSSDLVLADAPDAPGADADKPAEPPAPVDAVPADAEPALADVVKALAAEVASLKKALKPKAPKTGKPRVVASLDKATGTRADDGASLADQITESVNKAVAESRKADEAKIASLQAKLEKVLATPVQGAPVIMGARRDAKPPTTAAQSRRVEFLEKASRATDQVAKESWMAKAAREPEDS